MEQYYLLAIVVLLASCGRISGLIGIRAGVRSQDSGLRVSTASAGNSMVSGGQSTVTVDTGSAKKVQNEPLDYTHVAGERNPEEWQTSVTPRRDVVYTPALQAQMDMVRQLGMKEVDILINLRINQVNYC